MNNELTVSIGDIFATNLPDGRHGAIKIIDILESSFLIATTKYIGQAIPLTNDDNINEILIQNRFFCINEPAVTWYDGKVPKSLLYVGNIHVNETELNIRRNCYGGKWSESCGIDVYYEWRWENDREKFELEVKEKRIAAQKLLEKPQKPKKMMTDIQFWEIISLLDSKNMGDDDKVLLPAIKALAAMSVKEIKEFAETLANKLYLLDTKEHAKNIGEFSYSEDTDYISADGFLYARCYTVASGMEIYKSAVENPINMPKDIEFESLLYLAPKAYEMKTKREFEYSTGCCYETFSNKEGWKKDNV